VRASDRALLLTSSSWLVAIVASGEWAAGRCVLALMRCVSGMTSSRRRAAAAAVVSSRICRTT